MTEFFCPLCDRQFSTQDNVDRHVLTVHKVEIGGKKPKAPSICSVCHLLFSRVDNLNRHMREIHHQRVNSGGRKKVEAQKKALKRTLKGIIEVPQSRENSSVFNKKGGMQSRTVSNSTKRFRNAISNPAPSTSQRTDHEAIVEELKELERLIADADNETVNIPLSPPSSLPQLKPLPEFSCDVCPKRYYSKKALVLHKKTVHSSKPPKYECTNCYRSFRHLHTLKDHLRRCVKRGAKRSAKQTIPYTLQQEKKKNCQQLTPILTPDSANPHDYDFTTYPEDIQKVVVQSWNQIRTRLIRQSDYYKEYNFRLPDLQMETITQPLKHIFEHSRDAYKVDIAFGFILRHTETDEVKYYWASGNTRFFQMPLLIDNKDDLDMVVGSVIDENDILEYCRNHKRNSSWIVEAITNMVVYVYPIVGHPIGAPVKLPNFVRDSHSVIALDCDPHSQELYDDNLCMFRALAIHYQRNDGGRHCRADRDIVMSLYGIFCEETGCDLEPDEFPGIELREISKIEDIFGLNIMVWEKTGSEEVNDADEILDDYDYGDINEAMIREQEREGRTGYGVDDLQHPEVEDDDFVYWEYREGALAATTLDCESLGVENIPENVGVSVAIPQDHGVSSEYSPSQQSNQSSIPDSEDHVFSDPIDHTTSSPAPGCSYWVDNSTFPANSTLDAQLNPTENPMATSPTPSQKSENSNYSGSRAVAQLLHRQISDILSFLAVSEMLFDHCGHFQRHEATCDESTKYVFPGGGYGLRKTIFQKLQEDLRYDVPKEKRFYPFRITYDFEAICQKQVSTGKLQELHELIPVSVSVCSNVPGYTEAKCFINGNPKDLVAEMMSYMDEISAEAFRLLKEEHGERLIFLEERSKRVKALWKKMQQLQRQMKESGPDSQAQLQDMHCELSNEYGENLKYDQLYGCFLGWMKRIKVIGFNSGKFDQNLIREFFIPYLVDKCTLPRYVIKKNDNYMAIALENMVFLDICNYIAPGISYEKFLITYGAEEGKGSWPYQYLDDIARLQDIQLPSRELFWSDLKQDTISQDDYNDLQALWEEKKFQSMRDLLEYYNNADVKPFLSCIEKLFVRWQALGIDMFTDGISLPGLALRHMFQSLPPHNVFTLWNEKNKHLHDLVKNNIVGGPSIIFTRLAQLKDHIRNCPDRDTQIERILGYDANSLYLWCLSEDMPIGLYKVWEPETPDNMVEVPIQGRPVDDSDVGDMDFQKARWERAEAINMVQIFRRKSAYSYGQKELEYVEWMAKQRGSIIQHRFNGGQKIIYRSKSVRYPVDGYLPDSNEIFQFHGCKFHGHGCHLDNEKDEEKRKALACETKEVTRYLRSQGYTVTEMYECEWEKEKKDTPGLQNFLNHYFELEIRNNRLSALQLEDEVRRGNFFGLLEVDIEVCPWDFDARQRFSDNPPIYKNIDVSINDIGEHMANFARENGFMKQPRRTLISSWFGRKILLASPMIAWLLENGCRISRIYQAIEFKRGTPFKNLKEEVARKRREADSDPTLKLDADLYKLIGNSYYGKTLTDLLKQLDIIYASASDLAKLVNSPLFRKLEPAGDNYYEVSMAKKKIIFNLPHIIAFFVYQYAKLKMLQFQLFLTKFTSRSYMLPIETDTDSFYFAIAGKDLDEVVKKSHFNHIPEDYLETKAYYIVDPSNPYNQGDNRTPGLFKKEWEGDFMACLNSKTYIGGETNTTEVGGELRQKRLVTKVAHKGISKKHNMYRLSHFKAVLRHKISFPGVNYGLMKRKQRMVSYKQIRTGLSYLYIKRKVAADGIYTTPLDI